MKLSELNIPAVEDCAPGVEPMGVKVLIVPAEVPEKVGSILLDTGSHEKKVFANQRGRIIAMSPAAFVFEDWPATARKPQVGDVILHESYIGEEVEGDDGKKYRLINDRAVLAVLQKGAVGLVEYKLVPRPDADAIIRKAQPGLSFAEVFPDYYCKEKVA